MERKRKNLVRFPQREYFEVKVSTTALTIQSLNLVALDSNPSRHRYLCMPRCCHFITYKALGVVVNETEAQPHQRLYSTKE